MLTYAALFLSVILNLTIMCIEIGAQNVPTSCFTISVNWFWGSRSQGESNRLDFIYQLCISSASAVIPGNSGPYGPGIVGYWVLDEP